MYLRNLAILEDAAIMCYVIIKGAEIREQV